MEHGWEKGTSCMLRTPIGHLFTSKRNLQQALRHFKVTLRKASRQPLHCECTGVTHATATQVLLAVTLHHRFPWNFLTRHYTSSRAPAGDRRSVRDIIALTQSSVFGSSASSSAKTKILVAPQSPTSKRGLVLNALAHSTCNSTTRSENARVPACIIALCPRRAYVGDSW